VRGSCSGGNQLRCSHPLPHRPAKKLCCEGRGDGLTYRALTGKLEPTIRALAWRGKGAGSEDAVGVSLEFPADTMSQSLEVDLQSFASGELHHRHEVRIASYQHENVRNML
jgi:hypothetical protein